MTCPTSSFAITPRIQSSANLTLGAGGEARRFRVVQLAFRARNVAWRPRHSVDFELAAPALAAAASPRAGRLSEPHGSFVSPNAVGNEVWKTKKQSAELALTKLRKT